MLAAAFGAVCATAQADAIAGATYAGVGNGGATVVFTVAADGTSLVSYRISNVAGDTCTFNAEGDAGAWEGAPIVDGWFDYRLDDAILFRGTFPGPQSASGTFRFTNRATSQTPACDSGTVAWTAATSAAPPPPAGGGSPAPGGGTAPGASGTAHAPLATHVVLRRLSRTRLSGRVRSAAKACRAGRRVTLWRGQRRIATTRTRADGTFRFPRSARVRGRRVRAGVAARTVGAVACAPGSSPFIRA